MQKQTFIDGKTNWTFYASLCFLGSIIAYLSWVAIHLQIQYNDSFAILINAREIANGQGELFTFLRPVFLPILYSPFFILENITRIENLAFYSTKLSTAFFLILFIWVSYKLLAIFLKKNKAIICVCLLITNRILIHIAPFIKEDLPAVFFCTLTLYVYYKNYPKFKTSSLYLLAVLITITILTRYNLAIFIFLFITVHQITACENPLGKMKGLILKKHFWLKIIYFYVVPIFLFCLIPLLVEIRLNSTSILESADKLIIDFQRLISLHTTPETQTENLIFLTISSSWPIIFLAISGLIISIKNKIPGTLFFGLWLGIFFFIHNFIFGHREARYLLPILVPMYFFAFLGLKNLICYFDRRLPKFLTISIILITLMLPLQNAIKECLHFNDDIYRNNFEQSISKKATDLAAQHNIFWVGEMYPLVPNNFIFQNNDEFFYLYHFFNNVVTFYTQKNCPVFLQSKFVQFDTLEKGLFVKGIGNSVEDGDVLIINTENESFTTKTYPNKIKPLIIERIRVLKFTLSSKSQNGITMFTSKENLHAQIWITPDPHGAMIEGNGIPESFNELYLNFNDPSKNLIFQPFEIKTNGFSAYLPHNSSGINEIRLINYQDIQEFQQD